MILTVLVSVHLRSTASERHDEEEETEREGGEGAGVVLPSTPVVPQSPTSQVTTEEETTPCTRPIKTEQGIHIQVHITDCLFQRVNDITHSSDPSEFTTPQATPLDTNIASEFISSLKVPTYPHAAAMPCTDVCKMAISPPNV